MLYTKKQPEPFEVINKFTIKKQCSLKEATF